MTEQTPPLPETKPQYGPVPRNVAYQKAATYIIEALNTAVDIMRNSKNDNARLGAVRLIADKVLPDLKAQEHSFEEGSNQLTIKIVRDSHKDGDV